MNTYYTKVVAFIFLYICIEPASSLYTNSKEVAQTTYLCTNNTNRMLYYYPRNQDLAEERILHASPGSHFAIHTTNPGLLFLSIHPIKHSTSLESISIPYNSKPNGLGQIKLTINLDQHHDIFAIAS